MLKRKFQSLKNKFCNIDGKSRALYKNVLFSLIIKGVAIVVSLINTPIFMDYFDNSSILGVWFAILSMLNWILLFDFGIGNGLRNLLVAALEKGEKDTSTKLVSSAYFSLGVVTLFLSFCAYICVPYINWNSVCNVSQNIISKEIFIETVQILIIGVLLQFFLKLVNNILYALQKPAVPNLLVLISNVLLLIATCIVKDIDAQKSLLNLAYAYIVTTNFPLLLATLVIFVKFSNKFKLRVSQVDIKTAKSVVALGSEFLILQILSLASFNTREFYIMRFTTAEMVVPYQIYNKLFSLISTFFVLALTPTWSAITQAYAQNDGIWIKKTYKNLKCLFAFFVMGSLIVVALAQFLVEVWLGDKSIEINVGWSIIFAIFNTEYMWISLHSQFENGLGKLKIQKIGYFISTLLIPVIAYTSTRIFEQWIWIVVGNVLALIPLCIIQW